MSAPDCGTGTIVEPSRYVDEYEERADRDRREAEEAEMVERQWAAYVADRDNNAAQTRS